MHRLPRSLLRLLVVLPASTALAGGPDVLTASRHDTSAALSRLATGLPAPASGPDREGLETRSTGPSLASGRVRDGPQHTPSHQH